MDESDFQDEGPAVCLRLMQAAGTSLVELNAQGSRLVSVTLPSLAYYRPATSDAQLQPVMRVLEPLSFGATSTGVSELVAALDDDTAPIAGTGTHALREILLAMATAGVYRNRSSVGAVAALVKLWRT